MSWREDATCKELPDIFFYPPLFKSERTAPEHTYYWMGKMACHWCPVRSECEAEGKEEEFGLWGGKTPKERLGKDVKHPSRVLPSDRLHLLGTLGNDPDMPYLKEIIAPYLEKR